MAKIASLVVKDRGRPWTTLSLSATCVPGRSKHLLVAWRSIFHGTRDFSVCSTDCQHHNVVRFGIRG